MTNAFNYWYGILSNVLSLAFCNVVTAFGLLSVVTTVCINLIFKIVSNKND